MMAMPVNAEAMPPNPNTAATKAATKKPIAQPSMGTLRSLELTVERQLRSEVPDGCNKCWIRRGLGARDWGLEECAQRTQSLIPKTQSPIPRSASAEFPDRR